MCDTKRNLYEVFQLASSVKNSWGIKLQIWYAEQLCLGRKLHPMAEGDDPQQLGGDVIINCEGIITMIHRSKFPTDRPSVQKILSVVKK